MLRQNVVWANALHDDKKGESHFRWRRKCVRQMLAPGALDKNGPNNDGRFYLPSPESRAFYRNRRRPDDGGGPTNRQYCILTHTQNAETDRL